MTQTQDIIYETHPYYYPHHSFAEITAQIPSLSTLGINMIYLMPIWEYLSPVWVYAIYDYYTISSDMLYKH